MSSQKLPICLVCPDKYRSTNIQITVQIMRYEQADGSTNSEPRHVTVQHSICPAPLAKVSLLNVSLPSAPSSTLRHVNRASELKPRTTELLQQPHPHFHLSLGQALQRQHVARLVGSRVVADGVRRLGRWGGLLVTVEPGWACEALQIVGEASEDTVVGTHEDAAVRGVVDRLDLDCRRARVWVQADVNSVIAVVQCISAAECGALEVWVRCSG
mmetsp:Transcript_46912/g.116930  ORF Transcript_46912/g.116930 Transcript_46912/m.116930 type:complete len:214 (+) Transcript_46912:178-819(+)